MSTEAFASSSFVPQSPSHWVHDSARHSCRSCRTPFSLIKRRHHCRSCREVFCDSCSSYRLKSRSRREPNLIVRVRVCQPCFTKFKGKGRTKAAKTPKVAKPSVVNKQSIVPITEPEQSLTIKLDSGSVPSIVKDEDPNSQIWYSPNKSADGADDNEDEYEEDGIPEGDEGQTEEDDDDYNDQNHSHYADQKMPFSKFDSLPSTNVHDVTVNLEENPTEKVPVISIDKIKTEYSYTPPKSEDGRDRSAMKENENTTLEQIEGNIPTFEHAVISEEIKQKNAIAAKPAESAIPVALEQQKAAEAAVKAAGIEGSVTIATETVTVTEVVSPSSLSASAASPAMFPHVDLASPNPKVPNPLLDLLNAASPKPKEIEKLAKNEKEIEVANNKEITNNELTDKTENTDKSLVQSDSMTVNMDGPSPQPVVLTQTLSSGLLSPNTSNNLTQWPAKTNNNNNNDQNITTTSYTVNFNSSNMKSLSSFVVSPTSSGVIVSPTATNSLKIAEIDAENENWPDEENSVMSTNSSSPIGLNALQPVPATPLATTTATVKQSSIPLTISSVAEHSVMSTRSSSPIGLNAIYPVPATPLAANQTPTAASSTFPSVVSEQPRKKKIRRVVGVRKLSWAESLWHPVPAALMGVLLAIIAAVLLPVTLFLLIIITGIALVTPFVWPHVRHYIERHQNPPLAAHFDFLPKTEHEHSHQKHASSTTVTRPSLPTVEESVRLNERGDSQSNFVSRSHNNSRPTVRRPPVV